MSRDYKARKSKTSNGSKGGMLVGIFIGYALGVASAIGMWFYLESAPSPFLSTEQISAFDQSLEQTDKNKRNEGEGSKSDSNPAAKMEQKTQFDFYNILSNEKTDIFDFETLRLVGDCKAPGIIAQAIHDGHAFAQNFASDSDRVISKRERVVL